MISGEEQNMFWRKTKTARPDEKISSGLGARLKSCKKKKDYFTDDFGLRNHFRQKKVYLYIVARVIRLS